MDRVWAVTADLNVAIAGGAQITRTVVARGIKKADTAFTTWAAAETDPVVDVKFVRKIELISEAVAVDVT